MGESIYATPFERVGLKKNGLRLTEAVQVEIVLGANRPVVMRKESFITYENGDYRTTIAFDEHGLGYQADDALDLLGFGLQYAPALMRE